MGQFPLKQLIEATVQLLLFIDLPFQHLKKEAAELLDVLLDPSLLLRPAVRFGQLLCRYRLVIGCQSVEYALERGRELPNDGILNLKHHIPEGVEMVQHLQVAVHIAGVTLVYQSLILASLAAIAGQRHI